METRENGLYAYIVGSTVFTYIRQKVQRIKPHCTQKKHYTKTRQKLCRKCKILASSSFF